MSVLQEIIDKRDQCQKWKDEGGVGYDPAIELYDKIIAEIKWLTIKARKDISHLEFCAVMEREGTCVIVNTVATKGEPTPIEPECDFYSVYIRTFEGRAECIKDFAPGDEREIVFSIATVMAADLDVDLEDKSIVYVPNIADL